MAIIPVGQLPASGKGEASSSNVIPLDQLPSSSSQGSSEDMSGMYGAPLTFDNAQPAVDEGMSPINMGQRAALSLPSKLDSKITLLEQMGFKDIQKSPDGRLMIHGRMVDPKPNGMVSFLKDLGGDLADMVGPSIPVAGQIGADVATTMAAPETGGASLLGLAGANAAGAAGGEALRQNIANQMTGQEFSGGDMAVQAGLGAATPYLGAGIQAATKGIIRATAPMIKGIAEKLGDSAPGVIQGLTGIDENATAHYVAETRAGRSGADILNHVNSNADRQLNIAQRTLLGDEQAVGTNQELVNQYKRLISGAKNTTADHTVIDEAFRGLYPELSQTTLDAMKKYAPSELLNRQFTSEGSVNRISSEIISSIEKNEARLGKQFDTATAVISDPSSTIGKRQIQFGDLLSNMVKGLDINDPKGVGILDSGILNDGYINKQAKEVYADVISKLKSALGQDPMLRFKIGGQGLPKEIAMKIAKQQGEKESAKSAISLAQMRRLSIEMQPLLDKAFKNLSTNEARPLAQFMSELRGRMAGAYPPLADLNEKWATLQGAKGVFGDVENGLQGQMKVQSIIKKSMTDDTTKLAIQKLDGMLQGPKILPRIQKLGAAQELSGLNVDKGVKSLVSHMKGVLSKDPSKALPNELLAKFDSSIGQRAYKFATEAKDAVAAQEFTRKPTNPFRIRALFYMLGGGSLMHVNPAVGMASMLGTFTAATPKNMSKMLLATDAMKQGMSEGASNLAPLIGSTNSSQSRALLASLLRGRNNLPQNK